MMPLSIPSFPRPLLAIFAGAALLLTGCGDTPPGAKLDQQVGDPDNDSAAVANQLPPSQWEYASKDTGRRGTVENAGVERGFADASGGATLTAQRDSATKTETEANKGGEQGVAATADANDLEQRVRQTLQSISERAGDPNALAGVEPAIRGNEITLTGRVADEQVAQQLIAELERLPGQVQVRNELTVGEAAAE